MKNLIQLSPERYATLREIADAAPDGLAIIVSKQNLPFIKRDPEGFPAEQLDEILRDLGFEVPSP